MNAHLIEAKYIQPTDSKASRIKLYSHRYSESILIGFDHEFNGTFDQAENALKYLGYSIACSGETKTGYWFAVTEFKSIKGAYESFKAVKKENA